MYLLKNRKVKCKESNEDSNTKDIFSIYKYNKWNEMKISEKEQLSAKFNQ